MVIAESPSCVSPHGSWRECPGVILSYGTLGTVSSESDPLVRSVCVSTKAHSLVVFDDAGQDFETSV